MWGFAPAKLAAGAGEREVVLGKPADWKRRLLVTEVISLLILIASLYILRQDTLGQEPVSRYWLILPAVASLAMFISFLGLMYLRWIRSAAAGSRQRIQQVLFAMMALTLLGIWALAIFQTWQNLNSTAT